MLLVKLQLAKRPNITVKGEAPADGKEFDGKPGKFDAFFSSNPGSGT